MMKKSRPSRSVWPRFLPVLFLFFGSGCLPDNAFNQVLGENLLLTVATVIQTVTALVFNGLFGVS